MITAEISPAQVEYDASGTPYSPAFADCYFSRQSGLAETQHVFLNGNRILARWQNSPLFVIGETGFGTGLNFLCTWQAWQNDPQRCERLHFISIEKHPIPKAKLAELLAQWSELAPFATQLLAHYPPLLSGFHTLKLADGRITLSLCWMDINTALSQLSQPADAWYLDGFSPAKNAVMWQLPVMQQLARLSHSETTLATFTVAGWVRENLQQAGFAVTKCAGFGQKRHMLTAQFVGTVQTSATPWFTRQAVHYPQRQATIIGAGIAGCQMAHALAQRGWQVRIFEQQGGFAQEASGNRAGVISPKLTAQPSLGELFYRQCFLYAVQQLHTLSQQHELDWFPSGSLQLVHDAAEQQRWHSLQERGLDRDFVQLLNPEQACAIAGIAMPYAGFYFPHAGYLYPKSLCRALLQHPNIELIPNQNVPSLQRSNGAWFDLGKQAEAVVILANGRGLSTSLAHLLPSQYLPLQTILGQTSQAAATSASQALKVSLGHEGYVTPAIAGQHIFGATYERNVAEAYLSPTADTKNYAQLRHYLIDFSDQLGEVQSSHAAIRTSSPDRFPYIGAVPDLAFYQSTYADLKHGRPHQAFPDAEYIAGLYVLTGFGSRGLTTSALCAEHLASELNGEPSPLPQALLAALHPARYLIRQLRRG